MNSPGIGDRAAFFATWDKPILNDVPILNRIFQDAQSDTWASDFYQCKKSSIAGARLDRQETYDAMFLAWHWRLGAEQLLFSHQTRDSSGQPLFMKNTKPTLLACGVLDNVPWNEICTATQRTAQQMTVTPGRAWFLGQTGHSVHDERHPFFALEVIQFLGL
jgi:pimeloyl-ACP methyl ester carboxylesterase